MNPYPLKRTKIIATLGPATDKPGELQAMFAAGVDLVRLNFSHSKVEDHKKRIAAVRDCEQQIGRVIGVIADLQGPKIRIARFKEQKIQLQPGDTFTLNAALDENAGDQTQVGIDYKKLVDDVTTNDILLLDDGRIILKVALVEAQKIITTVIVGGALSNNKGINRQGGGLSAEFLTPKDMLDLKTAVDLGCDYIAVSFPSSADDIFKARQLITEAGGQCGIIAKIERTEAIKNIEAIIKASDAVMVARGDLGVEIGDAELPSVQKDIIHKCRSLDRAVITATQMMESMIENTIPTRAEVFDVANAILDGTDAVMLSAETAVGKHPAQVIAAASRICYGAERNRITQVSKHRLECQFERVDEAIAMAVMYTANHLNIKAIIALTESGSTPLWMSRIRSGIPIYALSRHISTQRKMTLYRGVYPIHFDITTIPVTEINMAAINVLKCRNILQENDLVILTQGDYVGIHGGTNTIKILQV